ncbi:hypothetical protein MATL_G00122730 [Megalops atlanticus]|uniref:Immunoglobulin subtype domain-containing protein n=1 Tax=Megalops atlanticus TaxID=7932 RepID=A0A9D3Q2Z7_MEGAT|nr:hypothetical protein MATL_G00122730 [Megalops atlanticus]
MFLDITQRWTLSVMFYFGLVSSQGRSPCESRCSEPVRLTTQLDSEVLLPCEFRAKLPVQAQRGNNVTVSWKWTPTQVKVKQSGDLKDLVRIRQSGLVYFSDPRNGRVKVFPTLSGVGNFSILIDRLQDSDLGRYCCEIPPNEATCSMVVISHSSGAENKVGTFMLGNWYFFVAGGALFFFLLIPCVCCVKFQRREMNETPDYINTRTLDEVRPPESTEREEKDARPSEEEEGGHSGDEIVYENDLHDPNNAPPVQIAPASQLEITSRSNRQQPNTRRPYYANQAEINKQAEAARKRHNQRSFWKRKPKEQRLQYENPIYANSAEQLDQL